MADAGLKALANLRIRFAPTRDDVWRPSPFHVDTLHQSVAYTVLDALEEARDSQDASPVGVVVQGQRGSGKTHLMGWLRERVQSQDGYFFLVSLLDGSRFWPSVAQSMLNGLARRVEDRQTQLDVLLRRLTLLVGVPFPARQAVIGEAPLTREALDTFSEALQRYELGTGMACRDTARALVMYHSAHMRAREIGYNFLLSGEECEPGERAPWSLPPGVHAPEQVVSETSWLLALTGPTVMGVDQIDGILAPLAKAMYAHQDAEWRDSLLLDQIASGLMALREATRRTLTVLAVQHASWEVIRTHAIAAVQDRFVATQNLGRIPSAEVGRQLLARRLEAHFQDVGFVPPYATWPVREDAFDDAVYFMPRQLLRNVDRHVRACVRDGVLTEMTSLGSPDSEDEDAGGRVPPPAVDLTALDREFAELRARPLAGDPLGAHAEDEAVPPLLAAGLAAWILEQGEDAGQFEQDAPPSTKPPLHARLRRTLNEETEEEAHWAFRAVSPEHHGNAVLNRVRGACMEAGLAEEMPHRRLFLLRNGDWPHSPRNREAVARFHAAGGRTLPVTDEDLRVLAALRDLLARRPTDLPAWLAARRPTSGVAFLRAALADAEAPSEVDPPRDGARAAAREPARDTVQGRAWDTIQESARTAAREPARDTAREPARDAAAALREETVGRPPVARGRAAVWGRPSPPTIALGSGCDDGRAVRVELEALRKHTAIFAGSGSGKTVLIRRIVEECALHGVSAIVLDPNNDLARLGDAWPEPPAAWAPTDAALARRYLEETDVVVWTPRREAGRPLSFQPLPDFRGFLDDADEFEAAVDAALESLAPRAKVAGSTTKAERQRAVLKEALVYYGRSRRDASLRGFVDLLADLPAAASSLDNAAKMAAELGQTLTAAMVIDPLFGGAGQAADPGVLLAPEGGKRARVSVVSLVGLPSDEQRQGFVNQLQMALFAWIKQHPAGDRPLGGLLVMDEAQTLAPSGAMTACTKSTLALASQARKYGLGLVFATQSPKGLHNRIPGNAATQLYGLLNAPAQIDAAREMARAKGGDVPGISQLRTGEFYAALEGEPFVRLRTPLCLTHHPKSPLNTEEVLERAARRRVMTP